MGMDVLAGVLSSLKIAFRKACFFQRNVSFDNHAVVPFHWILHRAFGAHSFETLDDARRILRSVFLFFIQHKSALFIYYFRRTSWSGLEYLLV